MQSLCRSLRGLQKINTTNIIKRCAHFHPLYTKVDKNNLPEYEVTKDPQEWEYVQRLLPQTEVPSPPTEDKKYPSGWKPQLVKPGQYPYYIERNKNHNLPVYLKVSQRGMKRHTVIRRIHGDIYALAEELQPYLQAKTPRKPLGMKVSEILSEIRLMGDYVEDVRLWLEEKKF